MHAKLTSQLKERSYLISESPNELHKNVSQCIILHNLKPGFHKANFDHDNNQFCTETKRVVGRMIAQAHNRFVFCVVVVEFAVNGNQA